MEIVSTTMSFREQTARQCLITTSLIYGVYLAACLAGWLRFGTSEATAWLVAAIAIQSVVMITIQIATAIKVRPEPKDERDISIELRSYRAAYLVLAVLVMLGAIAMCWTIGPQAALQQPVLLGHLLLICFVVAEITRFGTQCGLYRKES